MDVDKHKVWMMVSVLVVIVIVGGILMMMKGSVSSGQGVATGIEDCTKYGDEDVNGKFDCADPACNGLPNFNPNIPFLCENPQELSCADGYDNDGDDPTSNNLNERYDCADSDCNGKIVGPNGEKCESGIELSCNDGFDNDNSNLGSERFLKFKEYVNSAYANPYNRYITDDNPLILKDCLDPDCLSSCSAGLDKCNSLNPVGKSNTSFMYVYASSSDGTQQLGYGWLLDSSCVQRLTQKFSWNKLVSSNFGNTGISLLSLYTYDEECLGLYKGVPLIINPSTKLVSPLDPGRFNVSDAANYNLNTLKDSVSGTVCPQEITSPGNSDWVYKMGQYLPPSSSSYIETIVYTTTSIDAMKRCIDEAKGKFATYEPSCEPVVTTCTPVNATCATAGVSCPGNGVVPQITCSASQTCTAGACVDDLIITSSEICTNGIDDDGDGKIDYLDSECVCPAGSSRLGDSSCAKCELSSNSLRVGEQFSMKLVHTVVGSSVNNLMCDFLKGDSTPSILNAYCNDGLIKSANYSTIGTYSPLINSYTGETSSIKCGNVVVNDQVITSTCSPTCAAYQTCTNSVCVDNPGCISGYDEENNDQPNYYECLTSSNVNCGSCPSDKFCDAGFCYSYICTGTIPVTSELCPGDNVVLPIDTPYSLVSTCTDTKKCEYTCKSGYRYVNGACQTEVCTTGTKVCDGNAVKTCNPDGMSYSASVACTSTETCNAGNCITTCTPAAATCAIEGTSCSNGLSSVVPKIECTSTQTCTAGACVDNVVTSTCSYSTFGTLPGTTTGAFSTNYPNSCLRRVVDVNSAVTQFYKYVANINCVEIYNGVPLVLSTINSTQQLYQQMYLTSFNNWTYHNAYQSNGDKCPNAVTAAGTNFVSSTSTGKSGFKTIEGIRACIDEIGNKSKLYQVGCTNQAVTCTPSAEVCDGIDNDCDSSVDEGSVCTTADHCGSFSNVCSAGQTCTYGACVTPTCNPATIANGVIGAYPGCTVSCNAGYTLTNGACVVSPISCSYSDFGLIPGTTGSVSTNYPNSCLKRVVDVNPAIATFFKTLYEIECVEIYNGVPVIRSTLSSGKRYQQLYLVTGVSNVYHNAYYIAGGAGYNCPNAVAANTLLTDGGAYGYGFTSIEGMRACIDEIGTRSRLYQQGCTNQAVTCTSSTETCDGKDNDCDSSFDEGGVCNSVNNCGTFGNICATGKDCANGACVSPDQINVVVSYIALDGTIVKTTLDLNNNELTLNRSSVKNELANLFYVFDASSNLKIKSLVVDIGGGWYSLGNSANISTFKLDRPLLPFLQTQLGLDSSLYNLNYTSNDGSIKTSTFIINYVGENCYNSFDDDQDGKTNCEDSDCIGNPRCKSGDTDQDGIVTAADFDNTFKEKVRQKFNVLLDLNKYLWEVRKNFQAGGSVQ